MISREEALALLKKYNKEDFHIHHGVTVECVMRYLADKLGYEMCIRDSPCTSLFILCHNEKQYLCQ